MRVKSAPGMLISLSALSLTAGFAKLLRAVRVLGSAQPLGSGESRAVAASLPRLLGLEVLCAWDRRTYLHGQFK